METKESYKAKQTETQIELESVEAELRRVDHNSRFKKMLRNTVYTLLVVIACAILVAVLFMPVLRIYGNSMNPTLEEGQIVITLKGSSFKTGDVVGVYFGSKLLIKRVIATEGQWVDIDADGNVYVYEKYKGEPLEEPYLEEGAKAFGETDIELPCQVPPDTIFVMGDNRSLSIDSRNSSVGCVDEENVVGKIVLIIWPFSSFGKLGKAG